MSMFQEVLKHQSVSNINKNFIKFINNKYKNITSGQYLIERLIYKKINTCYGYNKYKINYSSLVNTVDKFDNFDIVFNNHDKITSQCALTYSILNKNIGVLFSVADYGFPDIENTLNNAYIKGCPLMLITLYDNKNEYKIQSSIANNKKYIKESHSIKTADKFPNLLEYVMMQTELYKKGPVHLSIHKDILLETVLKDEDPDRFNYVDHHLDDDNLSLLQYLEKQYDKGETHKGETHKGGKPL